MDKQDSNIKDSDLTLVELKAKKDYYQSLMDKVEESGSTQVSLTDPDSRMMRKKAIKQMSVLMLK